MQHSAYETLEISKEANRKEIKRKYKQLVRQFSPEQYPNKFMKIKEAYDFLTKPPLIVTKLPIYAKPLQDFRAEKSNIEEKTCPKFLLTQFFESPFNTKREIKEWLDQEKGKFIWKE